MEAVAALYAPGRSDLSEAIFSSLSRAVFEEAEPRPAGLLSRVLARLSFRVLQRTTVRMEAGDDGEGTYRNRLLERSQHPYAESLLASSSRRTESLVEGGDPMNGQYMMIVPAIRRAGTRWDRLFFNSVQGRDVQLRFIWETKSTYAEAKARLDRAGEVRLKALAAGTGLSMILAYDRLLQEGCDPGRITVRITDRDPVNSAKTACLLGKLAAARGWKLGSGATAGISAQTEDVFETDDAGYDVVTAVGILEYFPGFTGDTTERRLRLPEAAEPATAMHLAEKISVMTADGGSVIVNSKRPHASTRILELFGKRFDFRDVANVSALLATANLGLMRVAGTGVIYDLAIYEKIPPTTPPPASD